MPRAHRDCTAHIAGSGVVGVVGLLWPSPALAHGLQGRTDLPVPIETFYWAAAIVLVVSFVGLALGWHRPLVRSILERRARRVAVGRVARGLTQIGRGISVALLGLVIATALFGSTDLNSNFAPIAIYVVWWIGIAVCAATIGDVWRLLHPVGAVMRWLGVPSVHVSREYHLGLWPACAGLVVFLWLELVYPTAAHVRLLGILVLVWVAWAAVGMWRFGVDRWLDNGEPFSTYTGVLSGLAVSAHITDGRGVEFRPPVVGVSRMAPRPGLVPLAGLLIGSVSFDGLSRTLWWKQRIADISIRVVEHGLPVDKAQMLVGSVGFTIMVLAAIGVFLGASDLARIIGRLPAQTQHGTVAQAFAPTLVPIAFAYVVAHYFSFFWFQSQQLIRLASDPFGRGWNLFGTAGFEVDYSTLSANSIWLVQVGAIIIGHVLGLMLAHDRALEIASEQHDARVVRSQWAMLALMVLYTVGGLYFLSEGLSG